MEPPLWVEGASSFAHEREALAFLKVRLPNNEPYRAWTNVEFIADDGSVNEIDALVVTPQGLFLVEIKSYPGILFGDGQNWRLKRPNGTEKAIQNPYILTDRKAKRLKSLLARQAALRNERMPFVSAMVFLSSPELECRLHDVARTAICGRDPDFVPLGAPAPEPAGGFSPLPGIVAALKEPGRLNLRGHAINRPMSAKIAAAVDQAGLKPSNRGRKVGDWELGDLLDEGAGWQDFIGSRPRMSATRRIRVYLAGLATTAEEEDRLRREADREFRVVQGLRHDAIAQPLDLIQAERGPALLFDRSDDEVRLDLWAPARIADLPLDERIELVRQVGEALAHAHQRKVTHRGLTARSVLVSGGEPDDDNPRLPHLVVGHWNAGARELATRLTNHTSDGEVTFGDQLLDRLGADEQVYLAPEAFTIDDPDGVALDIFSLGAIAHLLLTGRPPAADLVEREQLLADHHGYQLSAVVDGLPEDLQTFVAMATDPVPAERPQVRELLELLDDALNELTAPTPAEPDASVEGASGPASATGADPLTAHQGDVLEGGWEVKRRLGSGSTAVALLCERPGASAPEVLKVAKDEEYAERLRDEARALEGLRHIGIVELFGVERIGGRTTLRLAPAGDPTDRNGLTLADRIVAHGRLGLDLLDRFGDDLLEIVGVLESEGVPHRDIKPDNLGVRPRRGDRSLHLVAFDFSLARTPDTSLQAGTPGYLDPFLAERAERRWDPAADRYAAAATLHEMATGVRPVWGDGRTDPIHLPDVVPALDPELFDPSVRDGLVAFFTKALHRRPAERFDTADQMRLAWRGVFAAAVRPTTSQDGDDVADEAARTQLLEAADQGTPVVDLGLSAAATSALDRLGLGTVEQLLSFPTMEWNRARGVGLAVRREVLRTIGDLRERLDVAVGDEAASVDRLAAVVLPKPQTPQAQADVPVLRLLLGLVASPDSTLPLTEPAPELPAWPGTLELRSATALERAELDALLQRARIRWLKQPAITQARSTLVTILERSGGVLAGDELALGLLSHRGSTATGEERMRRARAVVRASLEAESSRDRNRFTWRRLAGGASLVVALAGTTEDPEGLDGEELADYAANLGSVADQLAATDVLATPAAAIERLRRVMPPAGLPSLPDNRLARLAAAASATAAVSSRLELYPKGLPADRAVRIARATLLGSGTLSEADVHDRVRTRFPEAAPLPLRPGLDEILRGEVGLVWASESTSATGAPIPAGFRVPPPPAAAGATAIGSSGTRYRTGTHTSAPDDARAAAELTDERLRRHATNGGYLVLTVAPKHQDRAIRQLAALGARAIDLDAQLVRALRAEAETKRIDWDKALVVADAEGPSGPNWQRLLTVARAASTQVRAEVLAAAPHVVLTHPGLLARYELLGLLDELRERTRLPEATQPLRTLWVLVPAQDPVAAPTLGGRAVPITTATEQLVLPDEWLRNLHHTTASPAGALG